jgi:hypothetical protein
MKWFAETTEFAGAVAPNHVYLLDDSKTKMFAYVKFGKGKPEVFSKPIRIDTRGRKFVVNQLQFKIDVEPEVPEGRVIEVAGSKGNVYKVTELNGNYSCTCSGFKFRGDCRHTKEVQS